MTENSEVLSELRALRKAIEVMTAEIAAFRKENGINTLRAAQAIGRRVA